MGGSILVCFTCSTLCYHGRYLLPLSSILITGATAEKWQAVLEMLGADRDVIICNIVPDQDLGFDLKIFPWVVAQVMQHLLPGECQELRALSSCPDTSQAIMAAVKLLTRYSPGISNPGQIIRALCGLKV